MGRAEFANQKALQDYAKAHDLEYFWEGMNAFAKRILQHSRRGNMRSSRCEQGEALRALCCARRAL